MTFTGTPRIDERLIEQDGCWLWQGWTKDGYAYAQIDGRRRRLHIWTYETFVGPVPAGLVLDHVVCERRNCINPAHVVPETVAGNSMRSLRSPARQRRDATECIRGHAFDEANTYWIKNATGTSGRRRCRACNRDNARERYRASR